MGGIRRRPFNNAGAEIIMQAGRVPGAALGRPFGRRAQGRKAMRASRPNFTQRNPSFKRGPAITTNRGPGNARIGQNNRGRERTFNNRVERGNARVQVQERSRAQVNRGRPEVNRGRVEANRGREFNRGRVESIAGVPIADEGGSIVAAWSVAVF